MSSGSLKDLFKSLNTLLPTVTLPLPDDLLNVIRTYLEKHSDRDESDSHRLQEELNTIYQSLVVDNPSRLAPFLAILQNLRPLIRGGGRSSQWWDKLAVPVLDAIGEERGLAEEARKALLEILVYDEEEEDEDSASTSITVSENLLQVWLKQHGQAMKEFDDHARFVEGQVKAILLGFGKKRPKMLLTTINKFVVRKDSRIMALSLLCEFIRHQPPHLHQLLQTPLFENLLKCLQTDTSTRAISLAMTALVMFLPHIPSSLATHLPALFNIYSRMLFWDRERRALSEPLIGRDGGEEDDKPRSNSDDSWDKLSYLLESDDENVPELMHYFTFLYGLYPMNLMSYIRKPQKYLRNAKFAGADELDVEPTEMRQRSEAFRQVHLLHPNFYEMTIEDEITNNNRWLKSDPADVVAECMALYSPGENSTHYASRTRTRTPCKEVEKDADVPEEPLLDESDAVTPFQSRHNSWRNTQSTAVASLDPCRLPGPRRNASQTSQSMTSIADSQSLKASDRVDSPTLPPQMFSSPPTNALQDMLSSTRSIKGSLYRSLTNDSVASLAESHKHDSASHVDAYLQSLSRDPIAARSPSLRPSIHADPNLRVAYLQREIQLLRNDLNFERYLKQQHLSHIGQLRRKQIREARVEAETQNLINSNRTLKSRLEEVKQSMLQMKKETEKSKSHSRKWEADLTSKLRVLRDEQKKWIKEREDLHTNLDKATKANNKLRDLVVSAEAKELLSQQKMHSIASSLDETERLRAEVDKLTASVRTYEAGECQAAQDKAREEAALKEVEVLKMQLRARDEELLKSASAFENELRDARRLDSEATLGRTKSSISQDVIDSALAASRKRISEITKAHQHLLNRYTQLQDAFMEIKEELDQEKAADGEDEPALLSGRRPHMEKSETTRTRSSSPMVEAFRRRRVQTIGGTEYDGGRKSIGGGQLGRLDTSFNSGSDGDRRSPMGRVGVLAGEGMGNALDGAVGYHYGAGRGSGSLSGVSDDYSLDNSVKPRTRHNEMRMYGRGGIQNISKRKDKEKEKGKAKEGEVTPDASAKKKDKKGTGIMGIRGFG